MPEPLQRLSHIISECAQLARAKLHLAWLRVLSTDRESLSNGRLAFSGVASRQRETTELLRPISVGRGSSTQCTKWATSGCTLATPDKAIKPTVDCSVIRGQY